MSECQTCNSPRIAKLWGKTSDLAGIDIPSENISREGGVPRGLNVGQGDYFHITLCMECGQVQGKWPVAFEVE